MTPKFETDGYVYVKEFIDPTTIGIVASYLENRIFRKDWVEVNTNDPHIVSKFSYYADPLLEVFLEMYRGEVEKHTGLNLLPTYSYARVYQPGEELKPHVDRPSCEVSTTVSVTYNGDISDIYMQYNGKRVAISLNPGDAVIYKGCKVVHGRDVLKSDQIVVQFMLHYVISDGQFSDYKYDRRESLGFPNIKNAIVI